MPSFAFEGFTSGSLVALTAAQGTKSVSSSVSSWGQGSVGSIDILQVQTDNLVAPAAIWFEAINVEGLAATGPGAGEIYDPSFHEITYIWDFDDAGGFDDGLNIPDVWNDRNIAYGKRAAHVFRAPGTYQVSLWAVDRNGVTAQVTTSVTIADPETSFPGTRTICYNTGGNFAGAPAGSQQVTSVSALGQAIAGLSQPGRVLFRRGSDQEISLTMSGPNYNQNIIFGAFGSGARPILRPPFAGAIFSIGQNGAIKHLVCEGLDIRGRWNPMTEAGSPQDRAFSTLGRSISEMTTVLHDCRFSGLGAVDISTLKAVPFTSVVSDSVIEDWCLYGFFANRQNEGVNDNSRIALIGTAIQQNPDACKGADTGGFHGLQNQNGPVRYASARKFLMRSCYLFSNNSWTLGTQPTLRMITGNDGGCSAIADRVAFEGGSIILSIDGSPKTPGNFLFDKILLVGTADTITFARIGDGGTTLRNVLMWHPDAPNLGYGQGPVEMINSTAGGSDASNLSVPVAIHNVTAYDELSGNSRVFSDLGVNFTNYTEENNIVHAPNKSSPVTGSAPLDVSSTLAGFTPRYAGRRDSISRPQTQKNSDTANGATIVFSYPSGPGGSGTLSAPDFSPSDMHFMKNMSTGAYYYRARGDFTISFGGGSITVTNTTGSAMPSGDYRLALEYTNHVTDPQYATTSAVPIVRPLSGSSAFESAGGAFIGTDDLLQQRRPGLPVPGSGPETSSRGAIEPL